MTLAGLDIMTILLLGTSGLAAGLVNAIAGGGTFFTFSALVASGLPPVVANATSAVAVTPGNLSSSWAYRSEIVGSLRHFMPLAILSLIGGIVGAVLLTRTGNDVFARLVPWLLLAATLLFAASPQIGRAARALGRQAAARKGPAGQAGNGRRKGIAGALFQFGVAIYGGFFGAGMGIVMLAALALTEGDDFHLINAAKNLCATLIQLAAIVLFISAGLVSWYETLIVAVASLIGGYGGVAMGRRIPTPIIRWLVIAVGASLTVYFFYRLRA